MANTLDILKEPAGKTYEELVLLASETCTSFSLVWQNGLRFDVAAQEIADALKPMIIKEEHTDAWPGTKLFGPMATVRHYRMSAQAVEVLKRPKRLYAWEAPACPEDLAFYRNGAVWLGSIAHEKDSWLEIDPGFEATICKRLPDLAFALRKEKDKI